jgi:hypothetical protein
VREPLCACLAQLAHALAALPAAVGDCPLVGDAAALSAATAALKVCLWV